MTISNLIANSVGSSMGLTGVRSVQSSPAFKKMDAEARSKIAVASAASENQPPATNTVAAPALATQDLKKLAQMLQQRVAARSPDLQFSVDQDSGKSVIKVTDRTTHELVLQIPSEVALKVTKEIDQFLKGSLLNHKV
jgi:flagellar protein FlaG